jgi:hypothetical protein
MPNPRLLMSRLPRSTFQPRLLMSRQVTRIMVIRTIGVTFLRCRFLLDLDTATTATATTATATTEAAAVTTAEAVVTTAEAADRTGAVATTSETAKLGEAQPPAIEPAWCFSSAHEPFHSGNQIPQRRFHQQMKVLIRQSA